MRPRGILGRRGANSGARGHLGIPLPRRPGLLLGAATTLLALCAYARPALAPAFLLAAVWVVPLAFALLPGTRAVTQTVYAVVAQGSALLLGSAYGNATPHDGKALALLGAFATTVTVVGAVVYQLHVHLHRRTDVAEAVAELGHRALRVDEPDELLREALRVAVSLIGADYGTALRALSEDQLRVAAELGPDPLPAGTVLPLAERSYARHVLTSRTPFVSDDLRQERRVTPPEPLLSRGITSGLAVPVLGAAHPLGVLAVHSRRRRRFTAEEVAVAVALANVVATAWEQAEARRLLNHQAMHDSLTGLPNRALFLDRLQLALSRRGDGEPSVAVMLLDLDGFKSVNDRLGHLAGDELLIAVARRVAAAVRPEDTVARLGGDEFAVLCESAADPRTAATLAARMQTAVSEPVALSGGTAGVSASVGIATAASPPRREVSADVLLRDADAALYAAKELGNGRFQLYDEQAQREVRSRMALEAELRQALERQEFVVHYQPIRALHDNRVLGVEALVRWQSPARGLVGPDDFVPLTEQTGLIVPLGRWVLRAACSQVATWQQRSRSPEAQPLWVSVNLSPRQLDDAGLVDDVRDATSAAGLLPGSLALELTETTLLTGGEACLQTLEQLRGAGAALVLDDFGTGYSSLTHLTTLPIGALKVDRSFVAGLCSDSRDAAVVSSVAALGAELGVRVIAEGVETAEQLKALQALDCYGVQGFLLGRPELEPAL